MGASTEELRTRLLRQTLDLAVARAPFYRERLGGLVDGVRRPADLPSLPTTTKHDLATRGEEMLTSSEFPSGIELSSGTSFRDSAHPPAICFRSAEEIEVLIELRRRRRSAVGEQPLVIDITTSIHGARGTPPAPGCFLLPLEKPFHLEHLRRWLTKRFAFAGFSERVHYVAGPLNLVRLLAVALEETSPEVLPDLRLLGVFTHGDHLSPRSRQLIERILRAEVNDVYGLSEIAGSACMECPACGFFHAPPIVIPEVLSPSSDAPADGKGELVLTTLAPFQSLQPLIRYRTGDAVVVGPGCDLVDDLGFKPVGRIHDRSHPAVDIALTLPSHLVDDLVDELPDVARIPYSRLADFGIGPVYGRPIYELVPLSPRSARLEVELALPAHGAEPRVAQISDHLARGLGELGGGEIEVIVEATCT